MITKTRTTVEARPALQADEPRVFKKDEHWFYNSRDGQAKGPYIDKQHAYWALAKHIRQRCSYQ